MNNILQRYSDIGDNILKKLDRQTLLNSQLVCKQWREYFEHQPFFWLKLLDKRVQSLVISDAWKKLINKSNDRNLTRAFGNCLRMKFFRERKCLIRYAWGKKNYFNMEKAPPLYTAAYFGHIEIVKLFYDFNEDFEGKKITKTSKNGWYIMAVSLAIYNDQMEIAKFLFSKEIVKHQLLSLTGHIPLSLSIDWKNLELVKFLTPITNLDFQHHETGNSLIHLSLYSYKIFEYLVSLPKINLNLMNSKGKTPLQTLLDGKRRHYSHEETILMVKILIPMAKGQTFSGNDSPLHCAARLGLVDILKIVVEYFEMYINVRNESGHMPIDIARICGNHEAVQFLMEVKANC